MKSFLRFASIALAASAMVVTPLNAQSRGGGSSRGGYSGGRPSSGSVSRQSAPSRQSSPSMSRQSSPSVSRQSSSSVSRQTPSRTQRSTPSTSYQRQTPSTTRQSATPRQSSGTVTRQSTTPNRSSGTTTRQSTTPSQSSGTVTRQGTTPSRSSGTTTRQSTTPRQSSGTVTRQSATPSQGNGTAARATRQAAAESARQAAPVRSRSASEVDRNSAVIRQVSEKQAQAGRSLGNIKPGREPGNVRDFGGVTPEQVRMNNGHGPGFDRIPPRHRDPLNFNRPVHFWSAGPHYFGYRVHYLPSHYIREVYYGIPYYILDGIYYRHYGSYYYVCRPPIGIVVADAIADLAFSASRFAYYCDVARTYSAIDENARIITEQNSTIAQNNATIAAQNEQIALNQERAAAAAAEADKLGLVQGYADAAVEYFYDDGIFYKKNAEGKYTTITPPAGALVKELPDDYEPVEIDGTEFYMVDNTVYRITVVDGAPMFEVLGQMTGEKAAQYNQYE